MWDMQQSCQTGFVDAALRSSGRHDTQDQLVAAIPGIYYSGNDRPVVVDKCRSWTLPANVDLIRRYIRPDPKIIVMTRDVNEIIQSFHAAYHRAGQELSNDDLLLPDSEPLTRPLQGVEWARDNNRGEYFFIEYADVVENTHSVLADLYAFCKWDSFDHDLSNIVDPFPVEDEILGVKGLHDVRRTIGYRT
jgi:hypothetical protein